MLELEQRGAPRLGVFVDAVEVRFVPQAGALQIDRPFRISEITQGFDESLPVLARAGRGRQARDCCDRIGALSHAVQHTLRGCGSYAGQQMQQTESRDTVAGIFDEP